MMLSVYPIAALTVIALTGAAGLVYKSDQMRKRREAVAARAEWEHQALVAAAVQPTSIDPAPPPASRGNVVHRQRGADHWSTTQPIRGGCR